jgi:prepilin-type N-terminal cleavage/methylation domain-containing protein
MKNRHVSKRRLSTQRSAGILPAFEAMSAGRQMGFRCGQDAHGPFGTSPVRRERCAAGFSLIEVVIALGIISFALVAVIGLLPTGLNSQRQAVNQAFGAQTLNDVAQGIQGIYTATNGTLMFGPPLGGVAVAPGTSTLTVYEDGSLTNSASTPRGKVYIEQKPLINSTLRPVFVSVAWPQTATNSAGTWSDAQGSVSAFLYLPQ